MYGNLVSSDILPRYMFFPTYKTLNKGFQGVLHDWDPRWGPPETTPHFHPKWKSAHSGFELKSEIFLGVEIFICVTAFFFTFFEWKKWKNVCDRGLTFMHYQIAKAV